MYLLVAITFSLSVQNQDSKIQELERRVAELEQERKNTSPTVGQQSTNPLNALNPSITVFGNFLWRLDNHTVRETIGGTLKEIDDRVSMREIELDLRAAIDPYADGLAIIALESELPGEFEATLEEFHIRIKSLPVGFWEEPPLGAKITLGRFRTAFGRHNQLHLHDLPQASRPLTVDEWLGEEGHISDGASVQFFLPSPGDTALELILQAVQSGDAKVAQSDNGAAFLANLRFFWPLSEEWSLDSGFIAFRGRNAADENLTSDVVSLDLLLKWKPMAQGEYQSFVLGGQLFKAIDHEFEVSGVDDETKPLGFFVWAQYQITRELYLGLRYDWTETLADDDDNRSRVHGYASYYVSEFLRVRLGVERTISDDKDEDGLLTGLLEANVVFGTHPPHPFWVNR